MATYTVSTWADFVTAYNASTGTSSDPDVIEIMADLDVNTNPPTATISAGGWKIINGNFHTIWNLAPGGIINGVIITSNGNRTITWNKINFNNIAYLENNAVFNGPSSYPMVFNDCTFVAKVQRLFTYAQLNRCAVTMTGSTTQHQPMSGVTAAYSWIHYEHKRISDNVSGEFNGLNTCYIEGKLTTALTSVNMAFPIATNPQSCVFNIEIDDPLKCAIDTGSSTISVSVFNADKIANYTGTRANIVGVTDTQLKNAEYLASVGFDIVT